MLTNHLLYKAISKRQRDPDPFPLGWIKMKQLIVCPQGTQSPVLWEHITGIQKFHVHVILPETKQLDLRGCGDKRCTIAKVNWRGQIRISLFRIVVVYVSQIILKCPLMCATFFFFFLKRTTNPTELWTLCHFSEFLPCHKYFAFSFPKIASQALRHSIFAYHILHNKIQLISTVFSGWKSCLCPSTAMLGQDFLCWS